MEIHNPMGFFSRKPLFEPGTLLVSPGVIHSGIDYQRLLRRHLCGDWGDVSEFDKQENRRAVENDEAVLSQYNVQLHLGRSALLCVMTEAQQVHTVVFFLDEDIQSP